MKLGFGELELAILNVLKRIAPANVKEIQQQLPKEYAYTTIMTVCNRLFKKGTLSRSKESHHYLYELSSASPPSSLLTTLKTRLFKNSSFEVISYFIEHADDIQEEDLQKLEELIQKRKQQ